MQKFNLKEWLIGSGLLLVASYANAVTVNAPIPITHRVTVQLIQTDDEAGNFATMFGDAAQQAEIFSLVDQVWAQAGIDIHFLPTVNSYSNAFAYEGTVSPRPTSDLNTITSAGTLAGVANPDPNVINMYLVDIVPGFTFTSENTVNGLAFSPGNGIAMFVGDNLLDFAAGRDIIASVASHEIGHNLGLPHFDPTVETENLMCGVPFDCGFYPEGERLNAAQVAAALASPFAVAIPVPAAVWLMGSAMVMLVGVRRRA